MKHTDQTADGASGPDTDCGITWPSDRTLPTFRDPTHLDVLDVRDLNCDELFLVTLQGIVNRDRPQLYVVEEFDEGAFTWLDELDVESTLRDTDEAVDAAVADYVEKAGTVVIPDPDVPETVNVATTVAGVEDGVAATPERSIELTNEHDSLCREDLRGRFEDGSEAYQWLYDRYWESTSDRHVVGLPPTEDSETFEPFATNRDYAVATRAFTLWPDGETTDFFEAVLGELETNAAYLGWFGGDVEGEASGVERCSRNSATVVPTDRFANMTVFSGVSDAVGVPREGAVGAPDSPHRGTDTAGLENKVYVTLTYTEGDNLQYNQHRMRSLWEDEARGEVSLNWSISPLLADAAPAIIGHYRRTATDNDHLICGPSGAGYMYPAPWPEATLAEFTERTAEYMRETSLDTLYMLNRAGGEDQPLDGATVDEYADTIEPRGVTLNFWTEVPAETDVLDGKLVCARGPLVTDGSRLVETIEAETPDDWNGDEPAFVAAAVLAWSITPSQVADAVSDLGPGYELVTADRFFDLVREAHGD